MGTAMIFPGQGSQSPGAGAPWRDHPGWAFVEQVAEVTGTDVPHLLLDAGPEELTPTRASQLTVYVLGVLAARAAADAGLEVVAAAGHSLGEYTAVAAAGGIDPVDGARLVAARGAAMHRANGIRPGGMAAVLGLGADELAGLCETVPGDVWVANDNAPGQVVVAGDPAAIESLGNAAREAGARRLVSLEVGGAFHTPFMDPAQADLDAALGAAPFRAPRVPVWANVDAASHGDAGDFAGMLSRQLCSPVRWREEVTAMVAAGIDSFVELGPGNVLSGMVRRIAPDASRASAATPEAAAALPGA